MSQGPNKSAVHPLRNLLVTQFFGAFNDNAWKLTVTLLAIRALERQFSGNPDALGQASQLQTTLATCVITIPLILFSLPAGLLADRVSKRSVIVSMKILEVLLMISVTIFLFILPGNLWPLFLILGLMGAQSAIFSPAKYGILPEILPHQRLSSGNALLEMWTFLAIILGTAMGGALLEVTVDQTWLIGVLLSLLALVGLAASFGIPKIPAARSGGKLIESLRSSWTCIRGDRVLGLAVAGSVVYWTIASLLGQDILVYATVVLGVSEFVSGFPLAVFGLGVGAGSMLAGKLSGPKVEYGLIPLGAVVMALANFFLALWSPGFTGLLILMVLTGIGSGLLIVPLNALIQWKSPVTRRGGVIALSNVFVFAGVLAGSLGATFLAKLHLSPESIIFAAALMMIAGTIWTIRLLPDALLRLLLILATHSFYRLKILGQRNVPLEGAALLVPNHVSFVDGLMLIASLDRPIRFIVDAEYFNHWLLKPFLKSLGAIPISATGGPRIILRAFRNAGRYLDEGDIVCIFPEGQITRTGTLLPFRRGLERISKNRTAPIIPIYIDRLWGSIFSHEGGRFLFKVPKEIPYQVTVAFGEQLEATTSSAQVRQAVQDLASDAWSHRRDIVKPLHRSFIRKARHMPLGMAFADGSRPGISRIKALTGAVSLARALKPRWSNQRYVGALMPPTVPGVLVNIAALLANRIIVNLNYTAGQVGMESAIRQASLESLVTSRAFVEKAGLTIPGEIDLVWLEDIAARIPMVKRFTSFLAASFFPIRLLERLCGSKKRAEPDDVATVIFSSGSTGEPKGVMLTHFNIDSNIEAITQVLRATSRDRILGILPLFHSFGFLSLWFAANKGIAMPLHPNPLEASAIGKLIHHYRVTILLATPTFLQIYLRGCSPAQFGSIRLILTGAEKLSERLALAFEDYFGIRPLEGYGSTECSPVVTASVPDFRAAGFFQPGSRRGFVGQPLPGVTVKIADPDTLQTLDTNTPGMLLVKGPNVMKGYLGRDELTRKVMRDGWYVTGDIAMVDEDGFVKITDRLSRFSKIGGEMIPHGRVEEELHQAMETQHQVFAVTSVADQRKGESLAVLHTTDEDRIAVILEKLKATGLPNLFIPRKDRFLKVEQLPLLGSGKPNLKEIKRLAKETFE